MKKGVFVSWAIITASWKQWSVKDIYLELLSLCHWASPSEEASLCSTCSAACQPKDRKHLYLLQMVVNTRLHFLLLAQQNSAGHVGICRVERLNIPLHHCPSLPGCQSWGGCWDFDSWCQDGGLEPSGSDRRGAAAFSSWAAGSAGVKSADHSTKCKRRVENEESGNESA